MVKNTKHIITRIIIGVGIALVLGFLSNIADVQAAENDFQLDRADVNECRVPSDCSYFNGTTGEYWAANTASSIIYDIGNVQEGYYNVSFLIQTKYNTFYNFSQNQATYLSAQYTNSGISYVRLIYSNVHYFGMISPYGEYVFKAYFENMYIKPNTSIQVVVNFENLNHLQENGRNGTSAKVMFQYNPTANSFLGIQQGVNDVNDTLNDNNVSSGTNTTVNDLLEFQSQSNFGPVADLLLLPLTLFGALYSGFGGSCSNINLGSLLNHNITLPCINLQNILGSGLYTTIDLVISIFMIYNIILMCINIFDKITSLYDPFQELYNSDGGGK